VWSRSVGAGSLANWRLLRQKNGGNVATPLTGALRVLVFEKLGLNGEYTPATM